MVITAKDNHFHPDSNALLYVLMVIAVIFMYLNDHGLYYNEGHTVVPAVTLHSRQKAKACQLLVSSFHILKQSGK